VKLLRRGAAPAPEALSPEEGPSEVEREAGAVGTGRGKGRPTPKRRDVVGQRGPVRAPRTRKEAYARQKQLSKEARAAQRTSGTRLTPQQRRALLRAGDPSVLPRRDQGPTRKLARDYVDSRRMASNYLLVLFPLLMVSYAVRSYIVQLVALAAFFGFLVEWYFTGKRIRRLAAERFGKAEGGAMSLGLYAGSRAYLPRRWRLPKPQVELGDQI
jgi:hypothetical protein